MIVLFSPFLNSRKQNAISLVNELKKSFKYVSILGTDVKGKYIVKTNNMVRVAETFSNECGFVIKATNGKAFFEYSLDDISGDITNLASKIVNELKLSYKLECQMIDSLDVEEEKLVKSFVRESDFDKYSDSSILKEIEKINDVLKSKSDKIKAYQTSINKLDVSKMFVSNNKVLDQNYTWVNGTIVAFYFDNGKFVEGFDHAYSNNVKDVLDSLPTKIDSLMHRLDRLTLATPIKPGVYDVITDASITGLIAHEAFGHGVEMDQFVKDRALAKKYMNKYVASKITNMKDGAASGFSTASYFFDDDGVLATDTQIIKDGILVSGICDLTSSRELNVNPTANGRRESYKRKSYTRMTNTFIEAGNDKLDDMIKSIKHGYFLFQTNNGMEDPKNWQIQCTAEYGIEIVDGKLTDNYVSPVVMSGNVLDLLKSITMISDEFEIEGAGSCGKGYKEWVRVSSGGPNLKARVKLS